MSGMDGSNRRVIANQSMEWPNGLTFDKTTNRIYWSDAQLKSIEYIDMTTQTRSILVQDTIYHPFSMAVFEDNLFWSDWITFSLEVCNKFTGRNQSTVLRENGRSMMGVHVYHPSLYDKTAHNPCWSNQCSHMCLVGPRRSFKCACPSNMALSSDGITCQVVKQFFAFEASTASTHERITETKDNMNIVTRQLLEELTHRVVNLEKQNIELKEENNKIKILLEETSARIEGQVFNSTRDYVDRSLNSMSEEFGETIRSLVKLVENRG